MTKLLNLTIRINNDTNYKNDTSAKSYRIIEPSRLEIKDQSGNSISEFKTHIKNSNIGRGQLLVNNIRKIKISSHPSLDIPISWAWENKGATGEIEFTLKKIKYDEAKGFWDGGLGIGTDTLFLGPDDFEVETFESRGEKFFHSWQIFEVEANRYEFSTFRDFSDLYWKIIKAGENDQIAPNCPLDIEVKEWSNASAIFDEEGIFRELESINGNVKEAKKIVDDFLREVGELNTWKTKGIKTLLAAQVAKKNGFDIIADPGLRSQIADGKYQGFPIADGEKYQCVTDGWIASAFFSGLVSGYIDFSTTKNRFTKKNIDIFRKLFPNHQDQTDPKYFLGFRPGEIWEDTGNFKLVSYNHRQDFKSKTPNLFEIEIDKGYSRTYYEFWSCKESRDHQAEQQTIKEIIFRPEAFNELNKTKKEHWDVYWEWLNKFWHPTYAKITFGSLHQKLTELLPLLDKTFFANESQTDLEAAWKVLQNYESPVAGSDQEAIKNKFSTEIKTKRAEITSLMKKPLEEDIDAAANENYGFGPLNSERKRIFTTLRNQIGTSTLLTEIKSLIRLLIKGENLIPQTKQLEKKILLNQLKREYQNGSGDKKTAYGIVDQVDNQWATKIITKLEESLPEKETKNFLEEHRTQLLTKYDNSAMAQAVFSNNVLDSVAALKEADKLLVKVREAETKNDTDASLLKVLQNYQKASEGTLKNKAWQAVNSYNQQVKTAIKHLQKNYQSREELTKAIQGAENESKLEEAYNQAQNNELYQWGDKSRTVIDNLVQRKKVLFQIEKIADISPSNKTLLQIILTKLIPDTIKDDDDEQELTWLESQLNSFKKDSESEEKGKIYKEYKEVIDQILTEISQEKQRYQQTKQQDSESAGDKTKNPSKALPEWAWALIIMGVIVAIGSIIWVIGRNSWKRIKKSIKLK